MSTASAQFGPEHLITRSELDEPAFAGASDLDLDGMSDVWAYAVANGRLGYFKNLGGGAFGPFQELLNVLLLESPEVADLTGDGAPDIVVHDFTTGDVLLLINNGVGVFGAASTLFNSTFGGRATLSHDLDADGDLDLALLGATSRWYPNDGTGVLGSAIPMGSDIAVSDIGLADMDGDGDMDVLRCQHSVYPHTISWWQNLGGGTFNSISYVVSDQTSFPVGVTAADLDDDGDNDVVACGYDWVSSFENTGGGTFATGSSVLGSGVIVTAPPLLVDVNSDSDPDLVIPDYGTTYCLLGSTGMAFQAQVPISLFANYGQDAGVGDLNGDGHTDLVLATSADDQVRVCFSDGAGGWPVITELVVSCSPIADLDHADIDSDGDTDVLSAADGNGRFAWYNNDGSGNFSIPVEIFRSTDRAYALLATDLNTDGTPDVVCSSDTATRACLNNGDGSFAAPVLVGKAGLAIASGDLDDDGDTDIVSAWEYLYWYANDGSGTGWSAHLIDSVAHDYGGASIADMDNDGDNDVVAFLADTLLVWFPNDGAGVFAPYVHIPDLSSTLGYSYLSIAIGDMDGDADMDITACFQGGPLHVLFNEGGGIFASANSAELQGAGYEKVHLQDVDLDGDPDVMASSYTSAFWFENYGDGSFGPRLSMVTYANITSFDAADLDGDGWPEITVGKRSAQEHALVWYEDLQGSPFHASGHVYYDANANGERDPGEPGFPMIPLAIDPPIFQPYTDSSGYYDFGIYAGNYTIQCAFGPLPWQLSSDSLAYHIALTGGAPLSDSLDFGVVPNGTGAWLEPSIHLQTGTCSDTGHVDIRLANYGPLGAQGIIHASIDTLLHVTGTSVPFDSSSGPDLYWHFEDLVTLDESLLYLQVIRPSSEYLGDTLHLRADVIATDDLGLPLDTFTTVADRIVSCSFDPNEKHVDPIGAGTFHAVPLGVDKLTYTVDFQNTGNAPANTVVIRDRMDDALDLGTLHLVDSSHPVILTINGGGEAVFTFNNILLPDSGSDLEGSRGYVLFSVEPLDSLPSGTTITNSVAIHFDLNPPVITDTTLTTLIDCSQYSATITLVGDLLLGSGPGTQHQWFLDGGAIPGATAEEFLADATGNYSVAITNEFGCTLLSDPLFVFVDGVEEPQTVRTAVFPVPMTNAVTVLFSEPLSERAELQLMDMGSRVVWSRHAHRAQQVIIPRNDLVGGLYQIRVVGNTKPVNRIRIIVEEYR